MVSARSWQGIHNGRLLTNTLLIKMKLLNTWCSCVPLSLQTISPSKTKADTMNNTEAASRFRLKMARWKSLKDSTRTIHYQCIICQTAKRSLTIWKQSKTSSSYKDIQLAGAGEWWRYLHCWPGKGQCSCSNNTDSGLDENASFLDYYSIEGIANDFSTLLQLYDSEFFLFPRNLCTDPRALSFSPLFFFHLHPRFLTLIAIDMIVCE